MKGAVTILVCASIFILGNAQKSNQIADVPEKEIINDDPSLAPKLCAAKDSDGILVAHKYCNRFYKCAHGVPVALRCQLNLLYNPRLEQCDWPENVYCATRIIPDPDIGNDDSSDVGNDDSSDVGNDDDNNINVPIKEGNNDPSLAPKLCAAEGSDGVLVAHKYCNRFYKCVHGVPVALRCQLNLLYNPRLEQCDWPENVYCATRIIPDPDIGNDDSSDVGNDDSSDVGNDDDNNIDVPIKEGNNDPSLAPKLCAAEGSDGVLVAHKYCNRFYKCTHGVPVALRCQLNLLYNPRLEQCDWPENVYCATRIIPDPDVGNDDSSDVGNDDNSDVGNDDDNNIDVPIKEGNNDPSLAPKLCAAEGSDGVLVAHKYCNRFYKCAHGVPVALRCQLNLLYNPRLEQCDWPENVYCATRIIPDPEIGNDDSSDVGN